jgi:hypothetical protein
MLATSTITFQMMAVPDSTLYPSPAQLVNVLNTKKTQLAQLMSYYDPSVNFTTTPFVRYFPNFNGYPAFIKGTHEEVTFKTSLDSVGYTFVSIIKFNTTGTDNPVPTPYQIWRGYDALNVEVPHGNVLCTDSYADFQFTVAGLEASTEYVAYFAAGSMHPGYPDFTPDYAAIVQFKTKDAPISKILEIYNF